MKMFTATILDSGMESAIAGLPGWSHKGETTRRSVLYYPFDVAQTRIYFRANNRREAVKQLARCPFTQARDIAEWSAESPEKYISRKRESARALCMEQTRVGDFSRFKFFAGIYHGKAAA